MLNYDVIITGCARNIEQYLDTTLKKLLMIKELFKTTKIFIYENDSIDNTSNILKEWEDNNIIKLISEKNVPGPRTQRLAHGRNILYKEAMKYKFDYLIVIDLDYIISDLTKESIMSCFNFKEEWAMMGGNQIGTGERGAYYDIWALRTYDDWMNIDYHQCMRDGNTEYYCGASRLRNISPESEPIKVKSCFGGIGIYKRKYLDNCTYGSGLNSDNYEICEHTTFNECILKNGGSIYINPKLITFYNKELEYFYDKNNNNLTLKILINILLILLIIILYFSCKFYTKNFTNFI
jgi:hypothetical protein